MIDNTGIQVTIDLEKSAWLSKSPFINTKLSEMKFNLGSVFTKGMLLDEESEFTDYDVRKTISLCKIFFTKYLSFFFTKYLLFFEINFLIKFCFSFYFVLFYLQFKATPDFLQNWMHMRKMYVLKIGQAIEVSAGHR